VVSRSDQYSESGLSDWLPLSLWLIGVWKLVYGIPRSDRSTLSATNDHRSDFGIAHVYYIGLDTYKANSLLFGNAGGWLSFRSYSTGIYWDFSFKTVFQTRVKLPA